MDCYHAVLIDIDLASRTGVLRFLLHVLGEGPVEITPILASVFLYLVDSPRTRAYVQVGTDLEVSHSSDFVDLCLYIYILIALDGALRHYGCLWERSRSYRSYERVCEGRTADASYVEW